MAFLYAVDFKKRGTDEDWKRAMKDGKEILIGCMQRVRVEIDAKNPDFLYDVRFHERDYPKS
jgi:hypothetical protein